jgi:hypothetical protein
MSDVKGKSYIAENRELAFSVYCAQGGNVEASLRELEKQGLKLSKPTFNEWREKFRFDERLQAIDREKEKAADNQLSFEDRMLNALQAQKEKYERYFEKNEKLDHQAQYAFAGLIKTMMEIRERTGKYKSALFLDFMRDLITFLSKNDPGVVVVIEEHFDDFIAFAKEKYGA